MADGDSKKGLAMALGLGALFFLFMMFVSGSIKYYLQTKREKEEADTEYTMAPAPGRAPGPAAPSDVMDARSTLLQEAKAVLVNETDINVASPPTIPRPFTVNTANDGDKVIKYTLTFDIKVEKNMGGRDQTWTILDRGGSSDATGQRPLIQLKTLFRNDRWCIGPAHVDTEGCIKEDHYVFDKANTIEVVHKPSMGVNAGVGPQAGADYKNCTIVVRSSGSLAAAGAVYWDGTKVVDIDSNATDWGTLDAPWRWAGGQTAPNADLGYVKIKNAYIFGRDLTSDEVATLLGRGASASTYVMEPKEAAWRFNPSGYVKS